MHNFVSFFFVSPPRPRLQQLANARLNAESLRHHLMVNMRNETGLRYDLFEDFLKEVVENVSLTLPQK